MSEHVCGSGGACYGLATYHQDGHVEIMIATDGLPTICHRVPTPFMADDERRARFADARCALWMQGFWIEREALVRNEAFDEGDRRTTLTLTVRPCRTRAEATFVMGRIKAIGDALPPVASDGGR